MRDGTTNSRTNVAKGKAEEELSYFGLLLTLPFILSGLCLREWEAFGCPSWGNGPSRGHELSKQKMILRWQHVANCHLPCHGLKARFHQFWIPNLVFDGISSVIHLIPYCIRVFQVLFH
jgi:hypothetical protein